MAEPASLAERAGDLAANAGALAHNLELLARQLATAEAAPAGAGGTPFVYELTVFALAVFVGYYVVWRVTPALHSPLMSVTNAISSIIVIGALIQIAPPAETAGRPDALIRWLAVVGITLTCVNMFGGFAVTRRMLAMFRK
jgi:H+-translocating NAD(P) transhydrogenase subunit alpha